MRLKFTGGNVCPPDKFRFTCPHCGYRLPSQFDLENLFAAVKKHYSDNDHPLEADWREMVEDQMCQLLPAGWAKYGDGSDPQWHVNTRISGEIIVNGTRALLDFLRQAAAFKWFGGESPVVDKELAASRALTCSRCHFNSDIEGCSACNGIANTIAEITSGIETPSDSSCRSCLICGCSALAMTRMSTKLLKTITDATTLERYPSFCWKKNEIEALNVHE